MTEVMYPDELKDISKQKRIKFVKMFSNTVNKLYPSITINIIISSDCGLYLGNQ